MVRKAYNIQAIDPRPSLQKKSQFKGEEGNAKGRVGEGGTGHSDR